MKIKQWNNHTRIGSLEMPTETKLRSLEPGHNKLITGDF